MRFLVLGSLLGLVSVAGAGLVDAQEREPGFEHRFENLPLELEDRLNRMYGAEGVTRYVGDARIGRLEEVAGDVAARDGVLRVEGRVDGDVAMVDGDVVMGPEGSITGDVIVIGGSVRLAGSARVGGSMVEYDDVSSPGGTGRYVERDRDPWTDRRGREWADGEVGNLGFSQLKIRLPTYNRVEGLPVMVGPVIETRGPNPLRVEAMGVWRTGAATSLGTDRFGYRARVEQFVGGHRRVSLGGSLYSTVTPINGWQISNVEASLAAAGFHSDFRDHYERTGWSAFLGLRPTREISVTLEYRDAEHRSVASGDPWALFDGSDPWRPQPLVAEGDLRSVAGTLDMDFRDDPEDPFTGWYAELAVERGIGGSLARPELRPLSSPGGGALDEIPVADDFTAVMADVRRYHPVGRGDHFDFRVVAGGNVVDEPLPAQFQHALGGVGTLPGFGVFQGDCGARRVVGARDGATFFPGFGCDRFVMGQIEYRGTISLDFGFGDPEDDHAEGREDRDWHDFHTDLDPSWVVFFDAARGWSFDGSGAGGTGAGTGGLYDAGLGFLLDDVGIYMAVPLNEGIDRDPRFFIRLGRRF